MVELGLSRKVITRCKVKVDGTLLGRAPYATSYLLMLMADIVSGNKHPTGSCTPERVGYVYGGCFPSTIGSEKSEDFSFSHLEAYTVYGQRTVWVNDYEIFNLDHEFTHRCTSLLFQQAVLSCVVLFLLLCQEL